MMKYLKTTLKWSSSLLLVVLMATTAFFYLKTDHARDLILQTINQRIPGKLSCDAWRYSLIKGEIEFVNTALQAPPATFPQEVPTILTFEDLSARISWPDLLHGTLRVPSLILTAPDIHLVMDTEGRLNLLSALQQSPSQPVTEKPPQPSDRTVGLPSNIIIEDIQIQNGRFELTSVPAHLHLKAAGIHLQAGIDGSSQSGRVHVAIDRFSADGEGYQLHPAACEVEAVMQNDRLEPLEARLSTADSHLKLSGRLKHIFEQPEMTLEMNVDAGMAELQEILTLPGKWSGRLTANFNAEGPVTEPVARLKWRYTGGKLADYDMDRLQGNLVFQNQQLKVPSVEAMGENIRLEADGRLDLSSSEIKAHIALQTEDIQPLLQSLGITERSARLHTDTIVSGTLQHPEIETRVEAAHIAYGAYQLESVVLQAGLDASGQLKIPVFTLSQARSALALSATLQLFEPDTFQLRPSPTGQIHLEKSDLLLEDFHPSFKGEIWMEGDLRGDLRLPVGSLTINGKELDVGGQSIPGFELQTLADGNILKIPSLTVDLSPREQLIGRGRISRDGHYTIELESSPIHLSSIKALTLPKGTDANVQLQLSGNGTLSAPSLAGKISLTDTRINDHPLEDYTFHLDLQYPQLSLATREAIALSADYDLILQDFAASLSFDDTRLAPWLAIAGQSDLDGTLDGTLKAHGNSASPDAISVQAEMKALSLYRMRTDNTPRELIRTAPFTARFQQQTLRIPALDLTLLDTGKLHISGEGKLDGGPLAFQAQGRLPLKILDNLTEGIRNLKGNAILTAALDGSLDEPQIAGTLNLENIGLTVDPTGQHFGQINGRVRLSPRRILLEKITGQVDNGRFELAGTVQLDQFQPSSIDLSAKALSVPIDMPEMLTASFNSDLKFHGRPEKAQLEGSLTLLEGRYTKDVNLNLLQILQPPARRETSSRQKDIEAPFLKDTALDIRLGYRTPFQVDNNIALLDIAPDLHIGGTLNQPVISGRADVTSGTLKYQRKIFTIEKGVIDFINPYRIEPELDIVGQSQVRDWQIFLTLSGTPEALDFKLRSEPEESDEDILSLLLFGKTSHELIRGEGGAGRSAEQMLASFIAETYGEDIKRSMGIDIFEVDAGGNDSDAAEDAIQVTLGKELTRRMTVKYAVESTRSEMIQRAIAEYKLWEHFMLRSAQDTRGTFDASLVYRLEFR
jgi:hypothetical protein